MSQNNTIRKSDKKFIRTEKARIRRQFLDSKKQQEMIDNLYKKFLPGVKDEATSDKKQEASSDVKEVAREVKAEVKKEAKKAEAPKAKKEKVVKKAKAK